MSRTWTDEHTRRLNDACAARKAEGFCDVSCLFIGWCDWVYEDVRRADACGKGRGVRYALDYDEQDHRALMIARTRPGVSPYETRGGTVAFYDLCHAVMARNAVERACGVVGVLRPLDDAEE